MKRSFINDILIDGKPMLTPDAGVKMKYTDTESDSTGRDESGVMHRKIIRSDVKTWDFTYSVLFADEYVYLSELLRGKATFRFTFINEKGTEETVDAYCKQRSITYWSKRRGIYKNMQFSIMQC